ncbi:cell shape determination protein CcmA [Hydrogenophaga sp. Root209]|uniref:bactofilin family protein n=1 Tax=unclassified Hydrogenophaga TaxID=2610897 RepID=UPI0006FFF0AB|nr:polymer-forming cytoskeletal protein [Hydrogenophaga sp. Root209]KRB98874.1 cell shape determination protein CcmA [Hydrogenophaga sp. Root209]
MELKTPQDTLTIDPVAMNVVNRVAAGGRLQGELEFNGGLLVQGEISGHIRVNGPLIIWTGGVVRGRIRVLGDLYLFGHLGAAGAGAVETSLECQGMAYVSKTGVSTGTLMARRLQLYDGANLQGPFKTLKLGDNLPVLNDVLADPT